VLKFQSYLPEPRPSRFTISRKSNPRLNSAIDALLLSYAQGAEVQLWPAENTTNKSLGSLTRKIDGGSENGEQAARGFAACSSEDLLIFWVDKGLGGNRGAPVS
jgi:hypothetical protein